jgi:hypothetical protein
MTRVLIAVAAVAALAACTSNTCQNTVAPLSYGDCAAALDAGLYGGPTSEQRTACEAGCISGSDQTGVANFLSCINAIPAAVGTCSSASPGSWLTSVGTKLQACETTAASALSDVCKAAIALGSIPDAG